MPWYVRLFMVCVGAFALAFAQHSYADAPRASAEMRRVGSIPPVLTSVGIYRLAAALMGALGVMFITLAVVVEYGIAAGVGRAALA
jgi:hypothetical protein